MRAYWTLALTLALTLKVRSCGRRGSLPGVRFAFLFLVSSIVVTAARADTVDSREALLVRGEPVTEGDLFGTVALIRAREDEALEDVEPTTLPSRIVCTGTLITPTTVLTAGHCIQACPDDDCRCGLDGCSAVDADAVYVAAGLTDLESVWEAELVGVSNIVLHEEYLDIDSLEIICDETYCTGLDWDSNDIALLHLASPLTSLRPVTLFPEERLFDLAGDDTVGLTHGYGLKLPPASEDLLPEHSYVELLHQGLSEIEQSTQNELLTARSEENAALCFGDSGGPLYVVEGGPPMVAGVASRLRGDVSGECGGGGVYALVPAYTSWIEDNVTGELRSASDGGGGCSTSRKNDPTGSLLFLTMLVVALSILRRRAEPALLALAVLAMLGCGSSGETSFCSERYDPTGLACSREYELIDLRAAEALARTEVPADAWLWYAANYSNSVLSPDARADTWTFVYYVPAAAEPPAGQMIQVQASADRTRAFEPYTSERALVCVPTEPVRVLDSRRLVHDGIRFLEANGETVSLIEGGYLELELAHLCGGYEVYPNRLGYADKAAIFDSEGTFRSVVERMR